MLRELKYYCMQALRFMLINNVYWCASERMHAAHLVLATAEVVTESRTEKVISVSPEMKIYTQLAACLYNSSSKLRPSQNATECSAIATLACFYHTEYMMLQTAAHRVLSSISYQPSELTALVANIHHPPPVLLLSSLTVITSSALYSSLTTLSSCTSSSSTSSISQVECTWGVFPIRAWTFRATVVFTFRTEAVLCSCNLSCGYPFRARSAKSRAYY